RALGKRGRNPLGDVEASGAFGILPTRAVGKGQRDHHLLLLLTRCLRMQVSVAGRSWMASDLPSSPRAWTGGKATPGLIRCARTAQRRAPPRTVERGGQAACSQTLSRAAAAQGRRAKWGRASDRSARARTGAH